MTAGGDGSYEIKLTEGMKIDITTSAIVRDQKAIVYIDDIILPITVSISIVQIVQ